MTTQFYNRTQYALIIVILLALIGFLLSSCNVVWQTRSAREYDGSPICRCLTADQIDSIVYAAIERYEAQKFEAIFRPLPRLPSIDPGFFTEDIQLDYTRYLQECIIEGDTFNIDTSVYVPDTETAMSLFIDASTITEKQRSCNHDFGDRNPFNAALYYCSKCGICDYPPVCNKHAYYEGSNECMYCRHKK